MKTRSLDEVYNIDIMELKTYLLIHSEGCYQQDIHDLMNKSLDQEQLQKKLNKNKAIQMWLFTKIKHNIDNSKSYNEMEYHLIMMNLLINKYYQPLIEYKYKLVYYILDRTEFNLEIYCLIRHLLSFKMKELDNIIKGITTYKRLTSYQSHYYASLILLLEQQYKQAYNHLPYISLDESFDRFKKQLYNYSLRRYEMLYHNNNYQLQLRRG